MNLNNANNTIEYQTCLLYIVSHLTMEIAKAWKVLFHSEIETNNRQRCWRSNSKDNWFGRAAIKEEKYF